MTNIHTDQKLSSDPDPKPEVDQDEPLIAILIDGDNNTNLNNLRLLVEEAHRYGRPKVRRIYGNWLNKNNNPTRTKNSKKPNKVWQKHVTLNNFSTEHQPGYTASGKNATDIELTIHAMDLLLRAKNPVRGFVIVSSDSDFTPLISYIRGKDCLVIGFGQSNTPHALVSAYDEFYYVDTWMKKLTQDEKNIEMVYQSYVRVMDNHGWCFADDLETELKSSKTKSKLHGWNHYEYIDQLLETLPAYFEKDEYHKGRSRYRMIMR